MHISIRFTDDQLTRFENMIDALGSEQARVGLARAVNRVTRTVYSRSKRAIAKKTGLPVATVDNFMWMSLAAHNGGGAIKGEVIASQMKDLSLKLFGARQFSWGVRTKEGGAFKRYPHAFIFSGTWKSGNPVANGHAFVRVGKKSLPIRKLVSDISIPATLMDDEITRAAQATVDTMLPERASHELGRLLGL